MRKIIQKKVARIFGSLNQIIYLCTRNQEMNATEV